MIKYLFSILVVFSAVNIGRSQITAVYGNLNLVSDTLEGLPIPNALGFSILDFRSTKEIDFGLDILNRPNDDSNAISRIVFNLGGNGNQEGGNPNQGIHAYLLRPITKSQSLAFFFERISSPGWMLNSFARKTKIGGRYSIDISKKLTIGSEIFWKLRDVEVNGGLTGTDYSINQNQGQRLFGDLSSDIYLSQAYLRRTSLSAQAFADYQILHKASFSIDLGSSIELEKDKYVYNDGSPDSVFYHQFSTSSLSSFRDSNALIGINSKVYFQLRSRLDSNENDLVYRSDFISEVVNFASNGLNRDFNNLAVNQSLKLDYEKLRVQFSSRLYFSGFNAGDFNLKSNFAWNTAKIDTVNCASNSWQFNFLAKYQEYEPLMVFQYYQTSFGTRIFDYNKTKSFELSQLIKYSGDRSFVFAKVEYQNMSQAVFFSSDFSSTQYGQRINLVSPSLGYSLKGERFESSSTFKYQYNDQNTIYSLPEYTVRTSNSVRFRMFKKKIGLETGIEGWYYSEYFARGYIPMVDQMFIQSSTKYGNYIQLNPFAKAEIQGVYLSLIFVNAAYGVFSDDPLIAPGYPSIPRYLNFVIDWKFKN